VDKIICPCKRRWWQGRRPCLTCFLFRPEIRKLTFGRIKEAIKEIDEQNQPQSTLSL